MTAKNNISMTELKNHLPKLEKNELVLDVRSIEEYKEGHVPGSKNIPHTDLDQKVDELKKFKTIYIHCQAGGRAQKAFNHLQSLGFNNLVCISGSGMGDWIASGFPIEK